MKRIYFRHLCIHLGFSNIDSLDTPRADSRTAQTLERSRLMKESWSSTTRTVTCSAWRQLQKQGYHGSVRVCGFLTNSHISSLSRLSQLAAYRTDPLLKTVKLLSADPSHIATSVLTLQPPPPTLEICRHADRANKWDYISRYMVRIASWRHKG
jgi:hypothetical protein